MRPAFVRRLTLWVTLLFVALGLLGRHLDSLAAWANIAPDLAAAAADFAADIPFAALPAALGLAALVILLRVSRAATRSPRRSAQRMARGGRSTAAIAKKLRCSQDAVRGMLGA